MYKIIKTMAKDRKKIIAFDLDGVIIGKPPFIPKKLLEYLYRGVVGDKLSYRYPDSRVERLIRWLSHHPAMRTPIRENIDVIKKLKKDKSVKIIAISSRYSFLKERTHQWFGYYDLTKLFENLYMNEADLEPHIFKERKIKKIKPVIYIDDDLPLIRYLRRRKLETRLIYYNRSKNDLARKLKT